jgi:hypothetical protein
VGGRGCLLRRRCFFKPVGLLKKMQRGMVNWKDVGGRSCLLRRRCFFKPVGLLKKMQRGVVNLKRYRKRANSL